MLLGVLPDGSVAFSDSSAYAFRVARPGTGVWRVLRRPLRPIPVTNRMVDAERNRQLERLDESKGSRDPLLVRMEREVSPDGMVAFIETDELGGNTVVVKRLPATFPVDSPHWTQELQDEP